MQASHLLGAESEKKWLDLMNENIQHKKQGFGFISKFDKKIFAKLTSEECQSYMRSGSGSLVDKRYIISKCQTLAKALCSLEQDIKDSVINIMTFESLKINDEFFLPGSKAQLKSLDKIQFLCESNCKVPHFYHVIISDEVSISLDKGPNEQAYVPLLNNQSELNQSNKFKDILNPKLPKHHEAWTKEEKRSLKRLILMFGYERWSKIRSISKLSDKLINKKSDDELRAYSNYFIMQIAESLQHDELFKDIIKRLTDIIQIKPYDIKIEASASDFGDCFTSQAKYWAKRLILLNNMTHLVRSYKNAQQKFNSLPNFNQDQRLQRLYKANINILNCLSQEKLQPGKPAIVWTRKHDVDLIFGTFEHGFGNYENIMKNQNYIFQDISQGKFKSNMMTKRLKYIIKLVNQYLKSSNGKYDFEKTDHVKEASGFSLVEKNKLYEILINYGVPTMSLEDARDDWELLKILLSKHCKGEDAETNLNLMSTKIMKDYQKPVAEILAQWKEEEENDSDEDDENKSEKSLDENGEKKDGSKKEEEVNDFKIDKKRISAAHEYEKTCQRLVYDPDADGFNFGYERALTYKVRMNMFKLIRKEILAGNFRLFEQSLENLSAVLRGERELNKTKLPEEWICDKHDRNLLKAVSDNGLSYLNKMKENTDYGFENVNVPRKRLQKRLEFLCLFFKEQLMKLRKNTSNGRAGDLSTGITQIDPKKKFTKIEVERDDQGNIRYPITVSPTLQIFNLGTIEWERPFYHSEKNFFPIGFKSLREYTSMFRIGERCQYICEILDGGVKPMFKVTCSEDPANPIIKDSSSGVWIEICKKINDLSGSKRTNVTVSGPDRYGLAEPGVNQLLQSLPNSEKCQKYKFIF
eukprot:403345196